MTISTALDKKERFQAFAIEQLPRLYSMARKLTCEDTEDVVQEALTRAFQHFDQLESEAAGPTWLVTILINVCRDRGRASARRPEEIHIDDVEDFSLYRKLHDHSVPHPDDLHVDFLHQFGAEDVREVLLALPEIYRVPLVLVHMEGFATKEVAKMLEVPLGTVLARLHRGRKLFEKTLWEYAVSNGLLKEGAR